VSSGISSQRSWLGLAGQQTRSATCLIFFAPRLSWICLEVALLECPARFLVERSGAQDRSKRQAELAQQERRARATTLSTATRWRRRASLPGCWVLKCTCTTVLHW
jgi:hypothetical protein